MQSNAYPPKVNILDELCQVKFKLISTQIEYEVEVENMWVLINE